MKTIGTLVRRLLLGAPIASWAVKKGNLPKRRAIPLFGADGLSSVAYAPDEIILTLLLAGHSALSYGPLVGLLIAITLFIVVGTYRYNIKHVGDKGDFALVTTHLGPRAAKLLAAALMVDFILTVAVSLSSATGFLLALLPELAAYPRTLAAGLTILITLLCLRGMGLMLRISHLPAYFFLICLTALLIGGFIADASGQLGQAPTAHLELAPQEGSQLLTEAGLSLLLLRSFASGSVALTGLTTVSNSVKAFAPPRQKNAARSLLVISGFSAASLLGLLYLAQETGALYSLEAGNLLEGGKPLPDTYQQTPILLQLSQTIFAHPLANWLMGLSAVGVLLIAAMTAYTGFPLLATQLAAKQYLPIHLSAKSSISLFANGVLALGATALTLLLVLGPHTHSLIQMYIVGAFTALTLTQSAVLKDRYKAFRLTLKAQARRELLLDLAITLIGTLVSLTVLLVIVFTKFTQGAWLTLLLVSTLTALMTKTKKHYLGVDQQLALPTDPNGLAAVRALPSRVHALIYVEKVRKPALRALAYARASRPSSIEVLMVNVDPHRTQQNLETWKELNLPADLRVLDSPFRDPAGTIVDYVQAMKQKSPRDVLVIYLPEYLVAHWWQALLHRRTVHKLTRRLKRESGVVIASVPWPLEG
ncbi:MAG: amino acid permease [Rothia sp. (in: high G+C Gram-positive bacteria)]|nr:amino acid permease [Rothia sp. (in: high G+C Gram-positive bacteria)]